MEDTINKLEIFNREYNGLLGYAINLSNPTIANDALQLVYVYLNNKPVDSFKDADHVKHWLMWTTKVTCYEFNRKANRYVHLEDGYIDTKKSYNIKPYESYDRSMLNKAFRKAVEILSPIERGSVILYYLEDKDRHEIASILNTNANVVNVAICKGVKALKKHFKNLHNLEMYQTV
jgi:hypothetical protein